MGLPEQDAVCHGFEQGRRVGVDGQHACAVGVVLHGRVDVVGEGEALLL